MKKFNLKDIEKKVFNLERLEERERKRNTSGRFNRFGAYFIDLYLQLVISGIAVLILYYAAYRNFGSYSSLVNINSLPANWQIPSYICVYLIFMAYNVLIPYYLFEGQTFGKKLIGIKIVKRNGDKASLKDYVLRYLTSLPEGNSYFTANGLIFASTMAIPFATTLNNIALSIFALSILIAVIEKERRSIHDFLSNTKVISIKNLEPLPKKIVSEVIAKEIQTAE